MRKCAGKLKFLLRAQPKTTVFFSFGQFPRHLPPSNSALCLPPLNLASVPTSASFYIHILAVEPDVGFSFVNLQNIWTCSYRIQNQESVGLLAHCFDLTYQFTDHSRWIPPEYGHLFVPYASAYLDIRFLPHVIAAQNEQLRSWPPNINPKILMFASVFFRLSSFPLDSGWESSWCVGRPALRRGTSSQSSPSTWWVKTTTSPSESPSCRR